jgi:ATPase subunit of ABC transporter with duplicated ATPase domains
MEVVEQPREPWDLRMTIANAPAEWSTCRRLDDAVVDRGTFRLGPVDLENRLRRARGDRRAQRQRQDDAAERAAGDIELTSGTQRIGPSVRVGRLEQARTQLATVSNGRSTDARSVPDRDRLTVSDARTLLAKFGIGAEHVHRSVESLSPGERTRLVLALFTAIGSNCLVLDEPTNHLDLPAIEQIEQAVDSFPGTLLLVSHDRVLLEHVRRTRTIEVRDGQVVADRSE